MYNSGEQRKEGASAPRRGRRILWIWVAVLLAWAVALVTDRWQHEHAQRSLSLTLTRWIQSQDARVDALTRDDLVARTYLMDKEAMPGPMFTAFRERMVRMAELPFSVFLTLHDSLIYWNRGVPGVEPQDLPVLTAQQRLIPLPDGWYLPRQASLSDSVRLYALIPVKHHYPMEGPYLQAHFPASQELPGELEIVPDAGAYPLQLADGRVLGYLDFSRATKSLPRQNLLLLLFLLAGLLTVILFHNLGAWLLSVGYPRLGPLVFLVGIFGLRLASLMLDFTGHFGQMPLFRRTMDHPFLSHSIGDLLINVSLLLWIIIFFYRELPVPDFRGWRRRPLWLIGLVNYLAIALGLLALIHLFSVLVMESELSFRFDDIFHFNTYSFLSLLAVQLLLIALFLYSYRLLLFINRMGIRRPHRMAALLVATLLATATGYFLPLALPWHYLGLIILGYLVVFEFYADVRVSNLTWIILWMILFSGLASGFMYHFNNTKVEQRLSAYARLLIDPRDNYLESSLNALTDRLNGDSTHFEEAFFGLPYLKHYYQWSAVSDTSHRQGNTWSWTFDGQAWQYLVCAPDSQCVVLQQSEGDFRKVYTEILRSTPFKGMAELEQYRYILKRGDNILQRTMPNHLTQEVRDVPLSAESQRHFRTRNLQGLRLRMGDAELLIVHESGGRGQFLSLFSYLFCLLTITLFLITVLNTLFSFLPDTLNFSLSHRLSLRNRIQFSVISLIVLSFLIIGMITIFYFKNTTEQYHQERLQRKALGVAKDLEAQLAGVDFALDAQVAPVLRSVSRVHETDIDIYDSAGRLLFSSEPLVYRHRLVSPYMDGRAMAAMTWEDKSLFIAESRISQLLYRTAYMPMPLGRDRVQGYLAIPYYTDRSFLQQDISEFISALLNVYVFLLFIAGALAILVANSITYPISVIGEKLKQFKLGKQNEPLEWRSRDELGDLITEYNRMILKLQESAELLARSEREGAWREMARQVAHEIKNPLTPMKLSLQHLQHAFKPAREEDKQLINRVSATLIEQIENLNQIASAFSNFARIPEAFPEDIVINDLVRSVHNLFGEGDRPDVDFQLEVPTESMMVHADKNQLLRVLNNLVKNAIQAIPEDRKGHILIQLTSHQGWVRIAVVDNGVGIPVHMQEKVFMPNFTTKSSGTGLGLAICRNIIDQMQGRIFFQTRQGEGTTFIVELPAA
jgi:two-component system nitrogen regulation sensor histidine kinase NtrY